MCSGGRNGRDWSIYELVSTMSQILYKASMSSWVGELLWFMEAQIRFPQLQLCAGERRESR